MPPEPGLRRAVSDALAGQGYERSGRNHFLRIDDQYAWQIDAGPLSSRDVDPFLGLRHESVQRALAELRERPESDSGRAPTVSAEIGYLIDGNYRHFVDPADPILLPGDRWSEIGSVKKVMAAIKKAQEVLWGYRSLEKLPQAFAIPGTEMPGYRFTLATIYTLLGDVEHVREQLAELERTECRGDDAGQCERFRRFERNVMARLKK